MKTFYFKRDSNYDKEYGNKDWLYINNCGYHFNRPEDLTVSRTVPRADYHLLYISKGELRINGETLKSGDSYLYLPYEQHTYTYKKVDNNRYYWIHFTGNKVAEILAHCEISKGINKDNNRKHEKDTTFAMITEELAGCCGEASEFAVSLFFSFLSLFKSEHSTTRRYAKAMKDLQRMDNEVTISSIAQAYNISTSHFIRSFKKTYGLTPNEYRQNYRINQAMNLLKTTNLSVQDISYQCGFSDPFYFSRLFKSKSGLSPYKYRKE